MGYNIPLEALILLHSHLDALPARSAKRPQLIAEAAEFYGVSTATIRRAMRKQNKLRVVHRVDYNCPRVIEQVEMRRYCELIAALKVRTTNKKGRHLSTRNCIRILEEYGIETKNALVLVEKGLLKPSTISRYLKRWGLDYHSTLIEPTVVRFQAEYSNDCWQFDFSPSDLKKLTQASDANIKQTQFPLMLASVVDDRSGVCYQEYHTVAGEDVMTALRFLFNAMSPKKEGSVFQGIPKMLYMDNGPVSKSNLFKRVMAYLGIEIQTHVPKGKDNRRTTSRAKGKVERAFRTVKESLEALYHFHEPTTVQEANEWLKNYLHRYNDMPHRSQTHSRQEDWLKNLPPEGYKEMCSWDRFRTFAREPESRKIGSDAQVAVNGICYQVSSELAGQEVTLFWGLFDQELYAEYNEQDYGPFYPANGPIPLHTYKRHKQSSAEKRADRIGDLAKEISVPRTVLSGHSNEENALLTQAIVTLNKPSSIPFTISDSFNTASFKTTVEAKLAIAAYLGYSLSRLNTTQMASINAILAETLDKKTVMAQVRAYFSLRLETQRSG